MFIHLGEEIVIRSEDVIAIIDGQLIESSTIMSEFIRGQEREKGITEVSAGAAKSIVVTKDRVYFSPLSSVTLKRRSQMISDLEPFNE
ncbi:DUF370 domain-containing protein [Bacillus tianshenii]|nr:DUF370 domain-containing protein [Bacillus tianshenii]